MRLYTDKDFVDVVDEAGEPAGSVPKAWLGTDKVNPGVKKAGKSGKSDKSDGSSQDAVVVPEGEPTAEWTVKQIEAFAGANNIDLSGASNKTEKLAVITGS